MREDGVRVRRLATHELTAREIVGIRKLLWAAFETEGGFTEDDWTHSLGGVHFVLELRGHIVAHASVVERDLHVDGRPVRAGYVEAVATHPGHQGKGFGSRVMGEVASYIRDEYELGALGTGRATFYERLGWVRWTGPTSVRTDRGPVRTPEEDGGILVLLTRSSPEIDPSAPISCEWRPGDVW